MKRTMEYKGYSGSVEFSDEDNIFFGRIIGINDRILFDGDSVLKLRNSFHEAVDDYIDICKELGKKAEKTYKGTFNIRISPNLHKDLAVHSASQGKTLNSAVEEAIKKYIRDQ